MRLFILLFLCLTNVLRSDVVYIVNAADSQIDRVSSKGSLSQVVNTELDVPSGIALDPVGFIYISNYATGMEDGAVIRFPREGGLAVDMATELSGVTGLAIDKDGVLFAALAEDTPSIIRITAPGVFTVFCTLPDGSNPRSIAFSPAGDLYVANQGSDDITKITPVGTLKETGTAAVFSTNVTGPTALCFDSLGHLYVAQDGDNSVVLISNDGSALPVITGLDGPVGLGFDHEDSLYVASAGDFSLRKLAFGADPVIITNSLNAAGPMAVLAPRRSVLVSTGVPIIAAGGARIKSLGDPAASDEGTVIYKAKFEVGPAGITSANSSAILQSMLGGTTTLVVQANDEDFGTEGASIASLSDPTVNGSGSPAYRAKLKGGDTKGGNGTGLYADGSLVVRQGDQPDGFEDGVKFTKFSSFIRLSNTLLFQATISGKGVGANNIGIWDDFLQLLLRKGDVVQGKGNASKIQNFRFLKPVPFAQAQNRCAASDGTIAVLANLSDHTHAILRVEGSGISVVAQKNEVLDTDPQGMKFLKIGTPAVTFGGDVVYKATLKPGPGMVSPPLKGIFLDENGGSRVLIALSGTGAVGTLTPSGDVALFSGFSDPLINDNGDVAFRGTLKPGTAEVTVGNAVGIWSTVGGTLSLVARQGTQAPGTNVGTKFSAFSQYVLPDEGGVVVLASLIGQSVTPANNLGIWAADDDGSLQLVIRNGDVLRVEGTEKVLTGLRAFRAAPFISAQNRSTSAEGSLAVHGTFADGSQAIILITFP